MRIDTNQILSVTEANKNFSRATRIADKNGQAVIFKNNKPKYLLIEIDNSPIIDMSDDEKIDVIEWDKDPSVYIAAALLPAQVMAVDIREEERFAQVIVPDDQLSLAIGKSGQNARLAAKLTNWKIDIKSESQIREMLEKQMQEENNKESVEE